MKDVSIHIGAMLARMARMYPDKVILIAWLSKEKNNDCLERVQ